MKERPILFSAPMVRAILEGRKTQTRRVVKDQPSDEWHPDGVGMYAPTCVDRNGEEYPGKEVYGASDEDEGRVCPYGKPGDRLWVKETCYIWGRWVKNGLTKSGKQRWRFKIETPNTVVFDPSHPQIATKNTPRQTAMYWKRPSIFMPRWASRITLEITDVRVQRLQEISEEDSRAEGADPVTEEVSGHPDLRYRSAFHSIWTAIHGLESWQSNPWVWAITFKRV